jgi:transporter family-2 protein
MWVHIALAALSGFFLPLQAVINARTSHVLGGPLWAALVNFGGGFFILLVVLTALRAQTPTLDQVGRVPTNGWIAGAFGILFVAQAAFTVPKLGAAAMFSQVVAGQMFGSMAYEHFGVMQAPHPVTWEKALGAVLLLAGVFLILRPDRG